MKIGLIREGKVPPDKRVALSPEQCREFANRYPELEIIVQPSPIRAYADEEYRRLGFELREDLSDCNVLIGIKEVPIKMLIPGKKYLFFSHTFKQQPYNRDLLVAILKNKIQLIDYEAVVNREGKRLLGFGRYAGIVGCYNTFLAYGKRTQSYVLKPANQCHDRKEMEGELAKVRLPGGLKIVMTGDGRVGKGALEIINRLGIRRVSPADFLDQQFDDPVYTQLKVSDYHKRIDGAAFTNQDFYADPSGFKSVFMDYARVANVYIACHYWDAKAPYIFTREDAKAEDFHLKVVGDISCDIDGPVASTLRPSTIEAPLYGYDSQAERETAFDREDAITVMAVDNLPCELPRDASEDFGNELMEKVLPHLLGEDSEGIIERASETTLDGVLSPHFSYLQAYVDGQEEN